MNISKQECFLSLKRVMLSYSYISEQSFSRLFDLCHIKHFEKGQTLLHFGDISKELYFICKGILRTYIIDEDANIYNKNIFLENNFSGSKVSLILEKPSDFCIEALEDTTLISIPYAKYRQLIDDIDDLKNFYIAYLENKWVIEKENHEVSLVLDDATRTHLKNSWYGYC